MRKLITTIDIITLYHLNGNGCLGSFEKILRSGYRQGESTSPKAGEEEVEREGEREAD
ncbi:MAG: hypothetical protein P5700_16850 [Arthrospira platensis PCC 7345]|uniref:hypothetical protein n=1 Tax=Arthrospira sp. PCC 8006 TaxID=1982224 RepID=UPI0001D0E5DE|nr:hypothetical protein [Arthrospira sp. PLM2.Bin9]MDT9296692.1 hypothetical protein [Arthrospira platensis PCC 7345]BAI93209.1 hypothetical protein NIES39_N00920 [Arthrospira platensis NIES-39]